MTAITPQEYYKHGNKMKIARTTGEQTTLLAAGYHAGSKQGGVPAEGLALLATTEATDTAATLAAVAALVVADKAAHILTTTERQALTKATLGAGYGPVWDKTLNKALWVKTDLSAWVDSAGTTVA